MVKPQTKCKDKTSIEAGYLGVAFDDPPKHVDVFVQARMVPKFVKELKVDQRIGEGQ